MDIKVAHGILGWDGFERRSDRYGSIVITDAPYAGHERTEAFMDNEALKGLVGKRVRLTCRVVAARASTHIGDIFLCVYPSTPDVGEVVDFGVGTLSIGPGYGGQPSIVLQPGDGRQTLWLDPRKLYRLHDQTVDVFVEETEEDFTAAPKLELGESGVKDTEEGAYQMKTKSQAYKTTTCVEPLGGGRFLLKPGRPIVT